jgi:SH3-like domain-containing protein
MTVWRGIASIASVTPLLAIVFHLGHSAPATAKETWRVTDIAPGARIHLRQQPNSRSNVVAYIPGDARGLLVGICDDGWCQVEYRGFEGWVFARYLTRDNAPRRAGTADLRTPAQIQSLAAKQTLRLAKRDGLPLAIHAFPNERLPVAGSLPPEIETVQGLGNCVRDWCYVRSGELVGWLRAEAFAVGDDAKDQSATASLATSDDNKALIKTEPTASHAIVQAAATLRPLDLETKSYTLAGLGGQSSLAMREQPDGTSRILGWIPNGANDVEGLRKCVEKWCLVRHGTVSGWVARRHLADVAVESTQMFQAKGMELWGSLDVLDYPNSQANVVGKIPSYASGIVPIGGCDDDWCHVRYLGIAGWVSGQYLEPQAR